MKESGEYFEVKVECYAGHRADEDVRRFYIGERTVTVKRTLDRWAGVDHRYFKVLGDDDSVYILRQDTIKDIWELTLFSREKEGY